MSVGHPTQGLSLFVALVWALDLPIFRHSTPPLLSKAAPTRPKAIPFTETEPFAGPRLKLHKAGTRGSQMRTIQEEMASRRAKVAVARAPVLDRLFVGGGAALFAVLMGVVAQATWLYWR